MYELFLAVCLITTFQCNEVNVAYVSLPFDTHAIAAVDYDGGYHIFLDNSIRRKTTSFKRKLMVHEIAHLLVYEKDPTNNTHNEVFDKVCEKLSLAVGVKPNSTCSKASGTPSSWNPRSRVHYTRD